MSDRGLPDGYRHMHGFGSHTFSFINEAGERHWVKFHHVCQQGNKDLTDAEVEQVAFNRAEDADYFSQLRALFNLMDDAQRQALFEKRLGQSQALVRILLDATSTTATVAIPHTDLVWQPQLRTSLSGDDTAGTM